MTGFGEFLPLWQSSHKLLGNFLNVFLLFGKNLGLLWRILNVLGQIFVDVNGQKLKNNLSIWSHWHGCK